MHKLIKKYQWLIFDADNTLFDFDKAEQLALLKTLDDYAITYQTNSIIDIYHAINRKLWMQLETGEVKSQTEIKIKRTKQLFEALQVTRDVDSFAEDYLFNLSENGHLLDNAINVVEHLAKNHKLMIMTNGITTVQKPRLNNSPISHYFEQVIISEEIGHSKPSTAIFDHAFDLMNHPDKKDVVIIGDSLGSDIQGGINYNIDSIWYNPQNIDVEHNATFEINDLMMLMEKQP